MLYLDSNIPSKILYALIVSEVPPAVTTETDLINMVTPVNF